MPLSCSVASRRFDSRAGTSWMLRVTVFLRPARLRFCSTIIVRDIVRLKAKEPRGLSNVDRGSNALLVTNAPNHTEPHQLRNTEFSRENLTHF